MNKRHIITTIVLFCTVAFANAKVRLPKEDISVKFSWLSDTVNHKTQPYSAMLIPVKLNGCNGVFYMQFDLGSPRTFFYNEQLKDIIAKYPKADTTTFTVTKSNKKDKVIIGTIGEDFIDGKIMVINYPKQELSIVTNLTGNFSEIKLNTFMLMKGSVLFPALLNGKQTVLFFDTGSSAFELLTSKGTSDQLAALNSVIESYPVKSWGKTLTANTRPTADSLTLASQKIPIKNVTYIEGASDSQVQQMLKLGIGGMIGNKLFLNNVLIMDTKNKKFGIVQ